MGDSSEDEDEELELPAGLLENGIMMFTLLITLNII